MNYNNVLEVYSELTKKAEELVTSFAWKSISGLVTSDEIEKEFYLIKGQLKVYTEIIYDITEDSENDKIAINFEHTVDGIVTIMKFIKERKGVEK